MRTKVDIFDPCRLTAAPVAVALTSLRTAGRASAACKTALPTCTASGLILSLGVFEASSLVCSIFSGEAFVGLLAFVAALLSLFVRFAFCNIDPWRIRDLACPLDPFGFVAALSALPALFPSGFSFPESFSSFFCCSCGVFAWLGLCFLDGTLDGVLAAARFAPVSGLPINALFFLALSALLLGFSFGLTFAWPAGVLLPPLGERDFSVGLACFLLGELDLTWPKLVLRGMRERELRRSPPTEDASFVSLF